MERNFFSKDNSEQPVENQNKEEAWRFSPQIYLYEIGTKRIIKFPSFCWKDFGDDESVKVYREKIRYYKKGVEQNLTNLPIDLVIQSFLAQKIINNQN